MFYELNTLEDRMKAYDEIRKKILDDLIKGRIPTFHFVVCDDEGTVVNHYMTPVSLEPVDDRGNKAVWVQDFEFFLKLFLRMKDVVQVEYDDRRPAVLFLYRVKRIVHV